MLTFPSALLPLAQGKLRVGVFPELARVQEEVCLGALGAGVGVQGGRHSAAASVNSSSHSFVRSVLPF